MEMEDWWEDVTVDPYLDPSYGGVYEPTSGLSSEKKEEMAEEWEREVLEIRPEWEKYLEDPLPKLTDKDFTDMQRKDLLLQEAEELFRDYGDVFGLAAFATGFGLTCGEDPDRLERLVESVEKIVVTVIEQPAKLAAAVGEMIPG